MPSDHSSSSSSSSSSGSSHSGSSGGSYGGYSSGGHRSYHDNDSFDNHHYSDYWSPVSGLFWFVETEKGKWEELPSYYDTSKLWHMDKPTSGRYQGKDSIYVSALGRDCPYKEYVSCYYDEETNTYFYYNSFLRPAQWLYWYDDYGWLMYDSQTAKWYHLGEYINGISWNEMPSDWKDPKVWHFSNN